eukprot:976503-Prymnesium_polylepis.2
MDEGVAIADHLVFECTAAEARPCRGIRPAADDYGLQEVCDVTGCFGTISASFLWHVRDPTKYEGIASLTALERHDPDAFRRFENDAQ